MRVQRFTLSGEALKLYADGTIGFGGRLNLDVIASTNTFGSDRLFAQALLEALPAVGPPPLMILTQANRFLSNRVIYLDVSGTLRRPAVSVRPLPLLQDEAIRFFLGEAAGPAAMLTRPGM